MFIRRQIDPCSCLAFAWLVACSQQDESPPNITVQGATSIDLPYGFLYVDQGATAIDDVDGEVPVSTEGEVDIFAAGSYTVTYRATDAAGNSATAERNVSVGEQHFRLDVSVFGDLDIAVDGGPAPSCSPAGDLCTQSFTAGTTVTLTAAAGKGWSFEYWRECDVIAGDACTVTMDADKLVFATASNDSPVVLAPEVVQLTDAQVDAIYDFDPVVNVLLFEAGSIVSDISVGDLLLATGTTQSPIYFARRVVDVVALAGGPTILETRNAPLDEVILEGTLLFSPDMFASSQIPAHYRPGVSAARRPAAGEPLQLLVAGLEIYKTDAGSITLTGTVDVDFQPEAALDFTLSTGLRSARFSGTATTSANLGVAFSGDLESVTVDEQLELEPILLGAVAVPGVLVTVSVEPFLTFEAGVSVSVEPRIVVNETATLGLQYHENSGWTNLSAYKLTGDVEFPETLSADAEVKAGGGLKPTFLLYGLLGPYLRATAYGGGEFSVTPFDDCPFELRTFLGASFSAGGEISLLSDHLSIETNDVYVELTLTKTPMGCDLEPPGPPTDVTATPVNSTQIDVAWGESPDDVGIDRYEVWRRDTHLGTPHRVAETSVLSFRDTSLTPETEYCYYVLAVDVADNTSEIPIDLACAVTPVEDLVPPSAPKLVLAEALSSAAVLLEWTAAEDDVAIGGYVVADVTVIKAPFSVAGTADLSVSITSLNAETEYCYQVSAYDTSGNLSEPSNELCVTTLSLDAAAWTVLLGCVGQPFIIEGKFDMDEELTSAVQVVGEGIDYDGSPLTYVLTGTYEPVTQDLSANIYWADDGIPNVRQDVFSLNLSTDDSGIVPMTQVEVVGCDAQIQIIRSDLLPASLAPVLTHPGQAPPGVALMVDAR